MKLLITLSLSTLALFVYVKRSYKYASVNDTVESPIDYEETQDYKDNEAWFSRMGRCWMDKDLLVLLTMLALMSFLLILLITYFVIGIYYTVKAIVETREIDRKITVSKITHELKYNGTHMKDYEIIGKFEENRIRQERIIQELQRIKKWHSD